MDKLCVCMVCSTDVEENLLDALLLHFGEAVFTSQPAFSHGLASAELDPREQVLGRRRAVLVQILLAPAAADALLQRLHEEFAGTGIRYWMLPVVREGALA